MASTMYDTPSVAVEAVEAWAQERDARRWSLADGQYIDWERVSAGGPAEVIDWWFCSCGARAERIRRMVPSVTFDYRSRALVESEVPAFAVRCRGGCEWPTLKGASAVYHRPW